MSRIWVLRSAAGVVLTMVVGAWGLGIARGGDDDPRPPQDTSVPAAPGTPDVTEGEVAGIQERRVKRRPGQARTDASSEAPVAPGTEEAETPGTDEPATREPRTSGPTRTPHTPSPSGRPSPTPSSPSSPQCTDVASTVDCDLAPVTTRP